MLIESSTLKIFIYCCLSIYAKPLALYCTALYRIPLYCSVFGTPSFTVSIFLLVLTAYLSFYLPLSLSLFFPPSFFVLVFISLTLTLAISFSPSFSPSFSLTPLQSLTLILPFSLSLSSILVVCTCPSLSSFLVVCTCPSLSLPPLS